MRSSPPPSETSSIASNTPSNLNQYPNDWKCLHLKIQSWFYASLGTLCCFCTIRIADYILTLIYIQSSIGKSDSSNSLSRFHGILAFDVLQVLSVILLGTYGTYRMNSKLIGTYLMVQVSFLAVNSVLLVYRKFQSRVKSKYQDSLFYRFMIKFVKFSDLKTMIKFIHLVD